MIIRIESSHGDILISGKPMSFNDLNRTVKEILSEHDEKDFVEIFCSVYGYKVLPYTEGYAGKKRIVILLTFHNDFLRWYDS